MRKRNISFVYFIFYCRNVNAKQEKKMLINFLFFIFFWLYTLLFCYIIISSSLFFIWGFEVMKMPKLQMMMQQWGFYWCEGTANTLRYERYDTEKKKTTKNIVITNIHEMKSFRWNRVFQKCGVCFYASINLTTDLYCWPLTCNDTFCHIYYLLWLRRFFVRIFPFLWKCNASFELWKTTKTFFFSFRPYSVALSVSIQWGDKRLNLFLFYLVYLLFGILSLL